MLSVPDGQSKQTLSSTMGYKLKELVGHGKQPIKAPLASRRDKKPGKHAQRPGSVTPFHGYCVLAYMGQPTHLPPPDEVNVPVRHCPTTVSNGGC